MNIKQRLLTAFGLTSALASSSCGNAPEGNNAYDASGVVAEQQQEFSANSLVDGIHVVENNETGVRTFLVTNSSYDGFGMAYLPSEHAPADLDRKADVAQSAFSLWTVAEGSFVSRTPTGLYEINVPGNLINGEDLAYSVLGFEMESIDADGDAPGL